MYHRMGPFRIQYLSNLFLSNKNSATASAVFPASIKPVAPYIALLGNIGKHDCQKTAEFFSMLEKYPEIQRIFWIPGWLEMSSNPPVAWRKQTEYFYKSIQDWNLKKTAFCQKFEWTHPSIPLKILCTPGWHYTMDSYGKLYDWNSKGELYQMTPLDFLALQINELHWITDKVEKNTDSIFLLSYSPIPHIVFNSKKLDCHLYGTSYTNTSSSATGGHNPWCGFNMVGSTGYRPDAMLEWMSKTPPKYL
jgi:hypothetical protein